MKQHHLNGKVLVTLLLVLAMLAGMQAAVFSAEVEDGPLTKYPEPITITVAGATNAADSWKWDLMGTVGETVEDNRFTRLFKEALNIDVKYEWIVDSTQYEQKARLSIAAGDIPDYMNLDVSMLQDIAQMADADLIVPIEDLWEKYASEQTKRYNTGDGGNLMSAITYKGHMMGVPQPSFSVEHCMFLWLRTDWMEKLGLEPPKTVEDFTAYMKAVVESGIGGANTYGMLMSKDFTTEQTGIFSMFDVYPTSWIGDGEGGLMYGINDPKMIDGLKFMRQMYVDGWIDPEFFVMDYNKASEIVAAGQCGALFGYQWSSLMSLLQNKENDPEAEWGVYTIPTTTGVPGKYKRDLGLLGVQVVSKNAEHPEAMIKMANVYNEALYGEESDAGKYFATTINDQSFDIWYMSPYGAMNEFIDTDATAAIQEVMAGKRKPDSLIPLHRVYYDNCLSDWGWMRMFAPEHSPGAEWLTALADQDTYIKANEFYGAPTPTMTEKLTQLEDLRNTTVVRIITGEIEPEPGYNEMIANWKSLGGDQITEEVNEWYASLK